MNNPFSFIILFTRKMALGVKSDYVKMLASLAVFIVSIVILIKWNTIPTIQDFVEFDFNASKCSAKDSLRFSIVSTRTRESFNNPSITNIGFYSYIYGRYKRNENEKQKESDVLDSLRYIISKKNLDASIDSTYAILYIKTKFQLSSINECDKFFNTSYKDVYFVKKDKGNFFEIIENEGVKHDSLGRYLVQRNYISFDTDEANDSINETKYSSIVNSKNNPLRLLRLEDISRCYYSLMINDKNFNSKHISSIRVNFNGATSFSNIDPIPDKLSMSDIVYYDREKIQKICFQKGINMFCIFPDTEGIQDTRKYLLTTLASLMIGVFMKLLYEILESRFKRKQ